MKLLLSFLLLSSPLYAAKYEPLDIKAGLWRYEIVENSAIDSMLAKVPEAQREMMKNMLKGQMKSYDTCQTKEMLQDPEGKFKEVANKEPKMKGCDFVVVKSSKKYNHSKIKCPTEDYNTDIKINVISQTEQKQTVVTNTPTPNSKLVVKATWVGNCEDEK